MVFSIPDKVKKQWDSWNLRITITVSLALQAILILCASSRKRRGRTWIIMGIWSAYLLADWVAAVAVGLISSKQGDTYSPVGNALLAFWPPFLLLHLGGPDTITSFALEDNELWIRHLLGFILQVGAAVYIFLQSLQQNKLWFPTILVFIAGIIRYAERTRALYLASMDNFGESVCRKPNPGPEYERILQMYSSLTKAHIPARTMMIKGPDEEFQNINYADQAVHDNLDSRSLLQYAFNFFETFKGLIVGLLLSSQDHHVSREFFFNRSSNDVFRMIEIELSLMYEVLHTKVVVVRCKTGYIFRFINLCCIVGAFFLFSSVGKDGFHKLVIRLTNALLIGAIVLDIVSFILLIFSEWTIIAYNNWLVKRIEPAVIGRRRWSKLIGQYNFMSYCLHDYPELVSKLADFLRVKGILETLKIMLSLSNKKFKENVWELIFKELRDKARTAKTVEIGKKVCLQKGDGFLNDIDNRHLKWSVDEVEYVESLLLWHIATDLCYQKSEPDQENENREFCKRVSDYMFYLLVVQPTMMATVSGNWKIIFRDTYAETKRFLDKFSISEKEEASNQLLSVEAHIKPSAVKGGSSKSVLFDACILANELLRSNPNPWELMKQVWVELLSYAAINCRRNVHAQQPSKGGELLTFVWLLMNHLGLGTQFQEGNASRIKFIVRK